jgi:hypothetical protein
MTNEQRYMRVKEGKVHRFPAHEECNIDSVARADREDISEDEMRATAIEDLCLHCFVFPSDDAPVAYA